MYKPIKTIISHSDKDSVVVNVMGKPYTKKQPHKQYKTGQVVWVALDFVDKSISKIYEYIGSDGMPAHNQEYEVPPPPFFERDDEFSDAGDTIEYEDSNDGPNCYEEEEDV